MCQKRQQILARTGKWFQNPSGGTGQDSTALNAQKYFFIFFKKCYNC